MKKLSCYFCLQVILFSHIFCVSNSNSWERRPPKALASFPPITSNVTSLFSLWLPLPFFLAFSVLTAPQYPPSFVCLSLSVSHFAHRPHCKEIYGTAAKTNISPPTSHHARPDSIQTLRCERNVSIKYQPQLICLPGAVLRLEIGDNQPMYRDEETVLLELRVTGTFPSAAKPI